MTKTKDGVDVKNGDACFIARNGKIMECKVFKNNLAYFVGAIEGFVVDSYSSHEAAAESLAKRVVPLSSKPTYRA